MDTSTPGDTLDRLRFNYEGQLIEYLAQILGTPNDACELARNSFAALELAYPLRLPQFPKAALFEIATNLALTMLQRRHASGAQNVAADLEMSVCRASHGRQLPPEEMSQAIVKAILALRPTLRAVFVMAHVQGASRTEICGELGISMKRVDKLLTRALRACSQRLSSQGLHLARLRQFRQRL